LDIFVGNAGIFDNFTPIEDFPKEKLSSAFDELMSVNIKGYILGAKAAIPELKKTEGCMVFTSSHAGYEPGGGGVLYTTSKHAVMGMIAQLAYELAPTIRVNGVGPGGTMTDLRGLVTLDQAGPRMQRTPEMVERMRSGSPLQIAATGEDHAGIYTFLACKELSHTLTGIVIRSDAGVNVRGLRPWQQVRQQMQQQAASQGR
jgi:NAD(P)-dependent dehydrogenase (short-subunit alcohol dehydrogenase family)